MLGNDFNKRRFRKGHVECWKNIKEYYNLDGLISIGSDVDCLRVNFCRSWFKYLNFENSKDYNQHLVELQIQFEKFKFQPQFDMIQSVFENMNITNSSVRLIQAIKSYQKTEMKQKDSS